MQISSLWTCFPINPLGGGEAKEGTLFRRCQRGVSFGKSSTIFWHQNKECVVLKAQFFGKLHSWISAILLKVDNEKTNVELPRKKSLGSIDLFVFFYLFFSFFFQDPGIFLEMRVILLFGDWSPFWEVLL